jgi:hypothetical protein
MAKDNTDYSFMQTGFNMVDEVVDEEETKKNAISLVVAYSEGALRTAAKYITHAGRNVVTPEDVKRGMMLEMFLFKHRDDTLEKANEIKEELFGDNDDEDNMEDLEFEGGDEDEFVESSCECALCKCINTIYTRWDALEPNTEFERIFQKHINDIN